MRCYTIGHATRKLEEFIDVIKTYGIDCVMDFRKRDYGNIYDKVYDIKNLEKSIKKSGINYIYMGEVFEKNMDNKHYNDLVNFDNIMESFSFQNGINKVIQGIKRGHKIVIMCSEKNPFNCYRSILIGYALKKKGIDIMHIIDGDTSKTQERIEEEIFVEYEPILKKDFVKLTIQDIMFNENYDSFNEKDIKKKVIEQGYRMKFIDIN